MALVRTIKDLDRDRMHLHSEVEAAFCIFKDEDGRPVLQIETYGSPTRKIPGKTSQCIQFDHRGLAELRRVLALVDDS